MEVFIDILEIIILLNKIGVIQLMINQYTFLFFLETSTIYGNDYFQS